MTPRNFINAQIGSRKLYEQNQQAEWERARWMACVIINPHLKRSVDPKKITTFPWERKKKPSVMHKKDIEKFLTEANETSLALFKKNKDFINDYVETEEMSQKDKLKDLEIMIEAFVEEERYEDCALLVK